ncbi:hypothetical protein SUGI_0346660 [Cryptomeria japonica]|nr:hypothetical protein SUGI_0346660 [Cryptomeria japonica]
MYKAIDSDFSCNVITDQSAHNDMSSICTSGVRLEAFTFSNGDGPPVVDTSMDHDALDLTQLDTPAMDGGFALGVSEVACSIFGASRGSYVDRLDSGGGKGPAYVDSKPFLVCQSIAINLEEETLNDMNERVGILETWRDSEQNLLRRKDNPATTIHRRQVKREPITIPSDWSKGRTEKNQNYTENLEDHCDKLKISLDQIVRLCSTPSFN